MVLASALLYSSGVVSLADQVAQLDLLYYVKAFATLCVDSRFPVAYSVTPRIALQERPRR